MKKYQIYQLNKIKIIGGDLFFINNKGLYSSRNNIKKAKSKKNDLLDAHQINKTNYKFSPSMKIGEGAYCKVFYGINKKTNQECAVKFFNNGKSIIAKFMMEKSILTNLKGILDFPSLYYSSLKNLVIVESLHGPNLKDLFEFCDKKFPLRTFCLIGIEMINRIQEFHSKGLVHRDIKPSNFAWGRFTGHCNELKDHILLIDYDLSGIFQTKQGSHILFQKDSKIVGNLPYKSINGCNFISQTRRDDIESII